MADVPPLLAVAGLLIAWAATSRLAIAMIDSPERWGSVYAGVAMLWALVLLAVGVGFAAEALSY